MGNCANTLDTLAMVEDRQSLPVERAKPSRIPPLRAKDSFRSRLDRTQNNQQRSGSAANAKPGGPNSPQSLLEQGGNSAVEPGQEKAADEAVEDTHQLAEQELAGLISTPEAGLLHIGIDPEEAEAKPDLAAGWGHLLYSTPTSVDPGLEQVGLIVLEDPTGQLDAEKWVAAKAQFEEPLAQEMEQVLNPTGPDNDAGVKKLSSHAGERHLPRFEMQPGPERVLKVQDMPANTDAAKKLMDFEVHRLAGARLQEKDQPQIEPKSLNLELEEADSNLFMTARGAGGNRGTASVIAQLGSNTQPLPQSEEVLTQIVDKAKLMLKQNSSQMSIQLKPEFLGKLSIKILVEDGLVTARFVTDNHQVKQMLESSFNTLRQNLEGQGLKVDKTEVEVQLSNDRNFGGQHSWQEEPRDDKTGPFFNDVAATDEIIPAVFEGPSWTGSAWDDPYQQAPRGQMNILV